MCQAITWTNTEPVPWHVYVALGGDELRKSYSIILFHNSVNFSDPEHYNNTHTSCAVSIVSNLWKIDYVAKDHIVLLPKHAMNDTEVDTGPQFKFLKNKIWKFAFNIIWQTINNSQLV